jgi:hypothetical protein
LVFAARASLPTVLRVAVTVAGICGMLAAFGVATLTTGPRTPRALQAEPQPV